MKPSLVSRIRDFTKKHKAQIVTPIVLLLLSVMSYCICREPAAGEMRIPEWGTRYIFPAVMLISIVLPIFRRYFLSLSLFIGYHAGIALAAVGTDASCLFAGQLTAVIILVCFLVIGAWGELFSILLPRWQHESTLSI